VIQFTKPARKKDWANAGSAPLNLQLRPMEAHMTILHHDPCAARARAGPASHNAGIKSKKKLH
jgi:hypothetical protein